MTTVGTAQCQFWFTTGVHLHRYLNGALTTVPVPSTPTADYIPFGVCGNDGVLYLQSWFEVPQGHTAPFDLSSFTGWGYPDVMPAQAWTWEGGQWQPFNSYGVGMCRLGDDIVVTVLIDKTGGTSEDVAAGLRLATDGSLVSIFGTSCENLIQGGRNYEGVTYDANRNRVWINNETRGLQYVDVATNLHVQGPINGMSFYNGARWIEYQASSDTLWVTYNEHDILGLDPDDFSTKTTVPFCSAPSSEDGPYTAEVFCLLPNDTHMIVAGEGGAETNYNDGLWMVEIATGNKELVLGLDGTEDYWVFTDAFSSIWAEPIIPRPDLAGLLGDQRRRFWRTAPSQGQTSS
jgi:hypothetical protein